jgi:hypothetical protein
MNTQGVAIAVDPQFGVGVPRRQEVTFADGTSVWLQSVIQAGAPDLFKRRLENESGIVVDLRELAPDLAEDLPVAATRDVPGIVHYSLRQQFKSVAQLRNALWGGRLCK